MRFCIRREIDFANSEERLRRVSGVPIEIALPPNLRDFLTDRHHLMEVKRQLQKFNIPVLSVYAPHGQLADESFRDWAPSIIGFAEAVGAQIVVFQPEMRSSETRRDEQSTAVLNIKYLQDRTPLTVAVETFGEDNRVLTPEELMDNHLPIVLDTSLIPKTEITWIMESYRTHVVNVHLSAVDPAGNHAATRKFRPVDNDPFCLDILDRLHELGWDGIVTLEYRPWLSTKSMEDRHLLERIYRQYETPEQDLAS